MKKNSWGKWVIPATAFFLSLLWFVDSGTSAELRPFKIPEQKIQSRPPENNRQIKESVYSRFEKRVDKLSEEERSEWTQKFTNKKEDAVTNKKWDAAEHYTKLLEILNQNKE